MWAIGHLVVEYNGHTRHSQEVIPTLLSLEPAQRRKPGSVTEDTTARQAGELVSKGARVDAFAVPRLVFIFVGGAHK